MVKKNKTLLELLGGCIFTLSSIYAVNQIIFSLSNRKEQLYSKDGLIYEHDHGKLYYTKCGSGSPLLLLHNLDSASSSYEWNEVVKKLAKKHTVYTIDLLGCGQSSKPRITYTSYIYVQILHDFVTTMIGDTTDVIVTGTTSSLALMTEKLYSGTFHRFILVNPIDFVQASIMPGKLDSYRKDLYELPIIGTLLYNIYYSKSALLRRFRNKYFIGHTAHDLKYVRRYHEAAHRKGSASKFLHASLCNHYLGCNIENSYTEITNPTCVILGKQMEYEMDITEWQVFLNPDTEVALIPDSKFLPQIEQPEQFSEICEDFLAHNALL